MKTNWKIVTAIYMIVLAFVSLRAGAVPSSETTVKQVLHNSAHVPAYALLTYLLINSFVRIDSSTYTASFMGAFIFGVVMEVLQMFVPNRFPSLMDIFLNGCGAGWVVWFMAKREREDFSLHQ